MQKTVISAALEEAGFVSPDKKLKMAIEDVIRDNPKNLQAATEALLDVVRDDVDVAWAFMPESYRMRRANELLHESFAEDHAGNGLGQNSLEKQVTDSRSIPAKTKGRERRHRPDDDLDKPVLVMEHHRAAPNRSIINPETIRAANSFCHPALGNFRIRGKPIGLCTVKEVRKASRKMKEGSAFMDALTVDWPDTGFVEDYATYERVAWAESVASNDMLLEGVKS